MPDIPGAGFALRSMQNQIQNMALSTRASGIVHCLAFSSSSLSSRLFMAIVMNVWVWLSRGDGNKCKVFVKGKSQSQVEVDVDVDSDNKIESKKHKQATSIFHLPLACSFQPR